MRLPKRTKHKRTNVVEIVSNSAQKRAALLQELGRSPQEHPTFSLPSPFLPWGGVIVAILVVLAAPALVKESPAGLMLTAAVILAFFVVMLMPRKLLVGRDGLLLVWVVGTRFIRFRDINLVEMSEGFFFRHPGINLALVNGQAVEFSTSIFKERWAERDTLILLLRVCVEMAKAKKVPPVLQPLLRCGKTDAAWARALLAMGHGAHFDPRAPAVLTEDLWRVAENPDASPIERTAAFVALSASRDAAAEKRLRISLDDTVAPTVRSALRQALDANGDEERIAAVLAQAEKTSPPPG